MNTTLQILDYSEKAIAVIGDTKPIKESLKSIGGRFNPRLSCGAGWIFSKRREEEVRALINNPTSIYCNELKKTSKHWLFELAEKNQVSSKHISKFIREEAKKRGLKVRVKTNNSINVSILENTDKAQEFSNWCNTLDGKGFDGMIDMEYHYRHAINEKGDLICLGTTGTCGSGGYMQNTLKDTPKGYISISIYNYVFTSFLDS